MKIILIGATGFVGSEILTQLLARENVDRVTCLTRRHLAIQSPKLTTLLHTDFAAYPSDLAQTLADHDAILWAQGGKASDESDPTACEGATIACATAIAGRLKHPFRFGYLSGMGADPTETASFPWERLTRHLKGRTERSLQQLTQHHPNFRATAFRPAGILPKTTSAVINTLLAPITIRVDHLALAMIEESVRNIAEPYAVLNNSTLRDIANPSH